MEWGVWRVFHFLEVSEFLQIGQQHIFAESADKGAWKQETVAGGA
jgi:hypothetical protein